MAYFYPHRVTIAKNIITPDFILGKECKVLLDLASSSTIKLLKAVYRQDNDALTMSLALLNFLLNSFGNPKVNEDTPSVYIPKSSVFNLKQSTQFTENNRVVYDSLCSRKWFNKDLQKNLRTPLK